MKAVIFDLDGTLVDSVAAICANANALMDENGWPRLDLLETRGYIGHGARMFLEQALRARDGAYDTATFDLHFARLTEIYAAQDGAANPAYPGVKELLAKLAARSDLRLGMCTNKPAAPTKMVIEAHGWSNIFGAVIAGDELQERKPHPLPLLTAIERLGAKRAVYVGDSEVDAETSKAANIPFAFFTEGYCKIRVEDVVKDAVFSHHDELIDIIDRL